jgi:Helix-turn-helix domain
LENETQKQQNPPLRGGLVARRTGEYRDLSNPILPENLNRCKPIFLGCSGALSEIVRALRRDLIPNGEAMPSAHQFEASQKHQDGRFRRIGEIPAQRSPRPASARPKRREKVFGVGRGLPLDRNARARLMHRARALMQRTAPGKHYGPVTAKALAVLEALLWRFHNAKDGRCFPSYPRIAEAAGCAYSTVSAAIQALEAAGLLEWVNRIKRVRKWAPGLPGIGASRIRVVRTSNAYAFRDPKPGPASKFEIKPGTTTQVLFPSLVTGAPGLPDGIDASLLHLSAGVRSRNG